MTKAILISPESQSIEAIELSDANDLKSLIGFETIESDAVGNAGDRLFFDEECFIRGATGRFQIDKLIPVAGKGVVVGTAADGIALSDVSISIDELRRRTTFQ
ncbi:MAG: hypothetical protein LJE59_14120 [Chromatiaceae bacterium]|jgi:hypothetical protein|nr:hypothetical protein [Chromatiaceae bacterium]